MKISIENLTFAYKKDIVLDNLNFNIEKPSFTCIMGPNGSGKSTLIKCLDGILKPKSGRILIDGHDVSKMGSEQIAKIIAYLPQFEGHDSSNTVFDTVLSGRKPHVKISPEKRDFEMVTEIISRLKLDDIMLSKINELSGGQRQRAFIARALAQEPKILLLDEPVSSLDLKHTVEVLTLLKELSSEIIVLMSVHDINLAAKYCDRVILLESGKIFADGANQILTIEVLRKLYGIDMKMLSDGKDVFFIPE